MSLFEGSTGLDLIGLEPHADVKVKEKTPPIFTIFKGNEKRFLCLLDTFRESSENPVPKVL